MTQDIPIIGLMSGTSVDGIDAALVLTDGETLSRTDTRGIFDFRTATREAIFATLENPALLADTHKRDWLDKAIADDHAEAVRNLITTAKITPKMIGFHGQTMAHCPQDGYSIQSGCPHRLAQTTGLPIVCQFRSNDLSRGGQGAPLAPIYHAAVMRELKLSPPWAFVNIGGITNVTLLSNDALVAFDSGPGNVGIDTLMHLKCGKSFDQDGRLAAQGLPDPALIENILRRPYFALPPPKSLDRRQMLEILEIPLFDDLPSANAVASMTMITALSITRSISQSGITPKQMIIAGGGARNGHLTRLITDIMSKQTGCVVEALAARGIDGDFIEAEMIAFLAARRMRELPSTFPGTTGVTTPTVAGHIVR